MLLLDLNDGDIVKIGEHISILIDRCVDDGRSTRLGVEAPKEVLILREELITPEVIWR
jgi:carbon storage regulator CsrA